MTARVLVAITCAALCAAPGRAQNAPRLSGGDGLLYIGGYPNHIWILDEASGNTIGTIQVKSGIPRRMGLSRDRTRFYIIDATSEFIEVIDIAASSTLATFRLSAGNRRVRINSLEADPSHRYAVILTRAATRLRDRVEIGPSELQQIDLKDGRVLRTIPWPDAQEQDSVNLMFSPDGKLLYLLGTEIRILETETFTQVDRWDLSSLEEGLGQVSVSFGGFGGLDTINDEPGTLTTTMTVQDPVHGRRLMGVARIDLAAKHLNFYTLGPAAGVSFALAPDHKRAYGLESSVGRYQFWTFDLDKRRVVSRVEFEGRPRMSLKTSSNGRLLYIYNAGETIDIYDGASYRYLRTIVLPGDVTTQFYVVPRAGAGTSDGRGGAAAVRPGGRR